MTKKKTEISRHREEKTRTDRNMQFLLTAAGMILILVILVGMFRLFSMRNSVRIPDSALKKAIQEELDLGDREITKKDAERLTQLIYDGNTHDAQIADLTGISAFPHLQKLDVHGNAQIRDLQPLTGLSELRELDLHGNFLIRDLSPLAGLENLESLDLERVYGIRDISPLTKLPHLQKLNLLKDYFVEDLQTVASIRSLTSLNISGLRLRDIAFLEPLSELEELRLQNNQISDLGVLAGMPSLRVLNLYNNQVSDITPLRGLTQMKELDLGYNMVTEISSLAEMDRMTKLVLRGNTVSDIDALRVMKDLKVLDLDGCEIEDITPLTGMTEMEELSLYGARIGDLTPLESMTGMKTLELRGNPVDDLAPLSGMKELTFLSLSQTGVSDISPLRDMTKLERLEIWDNRIRDISALTEMTELKRLESSNNQIRDISALADKKKLEYLELDENEVEDISPLRGDTALRVLYLNHNEVKDIAGLAGLEDMWWLELTGNPVRDLTALDQLDALEFVETETLSPEIRSLSAGGEEETSGEQPAETESDVISDVEPDLLITPIFPGMDSDGDAVLVRSEGENLLMDTGNNTTDQTVQALKNLGIRELDIYLSHWHDDHYGQILRILDDKDFHVGKLYLPEAEVFTRLYDEKQYSMMPWWKDYQRHYSNYCRIMEEIEARGITVEYLEQGSTFRIGSAQAEVLYKNENPVLDNSQEKTITYINNSSLVTMITSKEGIRYLTCGDIEEETEQKILDEGIDIRCDIFKMNHHACWTSNTEAFLDQAAPAYAFYNIAEKRFNKRTYFCKDTVVRMMRRSNVFSNSMNGDMTFAVRGSVIDVQAPAHTKTETVTYMTEDGREETRRLRFNEFAPEYLRACALPEGAVYLSGGSDDLQIGDDVRTETEKNDR